MMFPCVSLDKDILPRNESYMKTSWKILAGEKIAIDEKLQNWTVTSNVQSRRTFKRFVDKGHVILALFVKDSFKAKKIAKYKFIERKKRVKQVAEAEKQQERLKFWPASNFSLQHHPWFKHLGYENKEEIAN